MFCFDKTILERTWLEMTVRSQLLEKSVIQELA